MLEPPHVFHLSCSSCSYWFADVYWKYEHRIKCTHEHCTTVERDRFEKSVCPLDSSLMCEVPQICVKYPKIRMELLGFPCSVVFADENRHGSYGSFDCTCSMGEDTSFLTADVQDLQWL